jgi:hypothetical protein
MQILETPAASIATKATEAPNAAAIMQIGTGFWASKVLFAAIKFRLFSFLGDGAHSAETIRQSLGLHPRSIYDFLDALVGLGLLHREGLYEEARYSNTPNTAFFLDHEKPTYIGGILEMCNDRLYRFWGTLEEGLVTGAPQNEARHSEANLFDAIYDDPQRVEQFMEAMVGIQLGAFRALARSFDFSRYNTLADIGGATGMLCIQAAQENPHLKCTTFDLPAVEQVAKKWINNFDLEHRIRVQSGDFFKDAFPKADVITMGNILHDWGYDSKVKLAQAAYDALPEGGAFVVVESIIDDNRKENVFGLLMSLNMLIETRDGYDFTYSDFRDLCTAVGFSRFKLLPLAGPTSAAIAYK